MFEAKANDKNKVYKVTNDMTKNLVWLKIFNKHL
jgi:hypothetical protein